jgi:hypothetical protein
MYRPGFLVNPAFECRFDLVPARLGQGKSDRINCVTRADSAGDGLGGIAGQWFQVVAIDVWVSQPRRVGQRRAILARSTIGENIDMLGEFWRGLSRPRSDAHTHR